MSRKVTKALVILGQYYGTRAVHVCNTHQDRNQVLVRLGRVKVYLSEHEAIALCNAVADALEEYEQPLEYSDSNID